MKAPLLHLNVPLTLLTKRLAPVNPSPPSTMQGWGSCFRGDGYAGVTMVGSDGGEKRGRDGEQRVHLPRLVKQKQGLVAIIAARRRRSTLLGKRCLL